MTAFNVMCNKKNTFDHLIKCKALSNLNNLIFFIFFRRSSSSEAQYALRDISNHASDHNHQLLFFFFFFFHSVEEKKYLIPCLFCTFAHRKNYYQSIILMVGLFEQ